MTADVNGFAVSTLSNGSLSYRAVASSSGLMPGETFSTEPPAPTMADVAAALTAEQKAAWAAYRQTLRDVQAQAWFPDSIDWPTQP